MIQIPKDEEREERIIMEIIVDAHGSDEHVMGWYYYLDDILSFPFKARCIEERRGSPLKKDEVVEVKSMADMDDCMREMFVIAQLLDRSFNVPLSQIIPTEGDDKMREAIEDWHYWTARGYEF